MLSSKYDHTFPNFSIGFPFTYYHQFLLDGNDFHHGFQRGIISDIVIIWVIIFILFTSKNKLKTTNQKEK